MTLDEIRQKFINRRLGPYHAWNAVSRTQVWQWCSAMGDDNPLYLQENKVIAPPTMLQMWTFRDLKGNYAPGSTDQDIYEVLGVFDSLGFSATVAVSYDQTYHHYLEAGDLVYNYSTIVTITDQKSTSLGAGYFVTEQAEYYNQRDELFGEATITYFKYRPPAQQSANSEPTSINSAERIRPVENHDSKHYWQGLREGKLLIQQCSNCNTNRHPPQPMCERCQSIDWHSIEAVGTGTIYSYTVMHYPQIAPFDYPNAIALVDLTEGVRLVAQYQGEALTAASIGQSVTIEIQEVQPDLCVPIFKQVSQ